MPATPPLPGGATSIAKRLDGLAISVWSMLLPGVGTFRHWAASAFWVKPAMVGLVTVNFDPLRTQCPRSTRVLLQERTHVSVHDALRNGLHMGSRHRYVRLTFETCLVPDFAKGQLLPTA